MKHYSTCAELRDVAYVNEISFHIKKMFSGASLFSYVSVDLKDSYQH